MTTLRPDLTFSLPSAMIQHLPFAEQIETVRAIGFQEFTLHPHAIGEYNRAGVSMRDMKMMVDDAGLRISRLDPLCTWVPEWQAWNFGQEYNLAQSMESTFFMDLSAFFECRHVSLNSMWKAGRYSVDEISDHYRSVCQKAQPYGLTCDIEPIPMWGIPFLETALDVIRKADVPNAGLVFDVTHFTRGKTSLDVLKTVPGDLVHCVQLCDGTMPGTLSLEEECFNRLWPGEGAFRIGEMIDILDEIGGLNGVGPEVFSPLYEKEGTPGKWIAEKINQSLARYPRLLA